tara:strand:+ start:2303 stop:3646 length:1344 start_codon:yes stop_codon:yes gene_type:complete
MFKLSKNIIKLFAILPMLLSQGIAQEKETYPTFANISEINLYIDESDFFDLIRSSVFDQPEFDYSTSLTKEQEFNLKFARRSRFPTISGNIINDESFERNISDLTSVRKRRDDSFDANVEIRQPIYSGGQINSLIKVARSKAKNASKEKQEIISDLILKANEIYINAMVGTFVADYGESLLNILIPYKENVKDRVRAGIMDPVDSAVFNVRMNSLETLISQLKSEAEKNRNRFNIFFKNDMERLAFPKIFVFGNQFNRSRESYDVERAQYTYDEKKAEIGNVRSEYLPKFGISARYTKYDIDDDSNEDDIRGGLYMSVPIFSFGRGIAKINSAKSAAEASRKSISIARKEDQEMEYKIISDFNNAINNREIFLNSFNDTLTQRKALQDRLELSGFVVNAFAEVIENEIAQIKNLLSNETQILYGHLLILHQNQMLNNAFKIDLSNEY